MQSAFISVTRNLNYLSNNRLFIRLASSETRQDEFSWSAAHEKNERRNLALAIKMQQDLFVRAARSRRKGLDTFARECFDRTRKRKAGKWKSKGLSYVCTVPCCRKDSSKASAETQTNWSRCRERTRWKSILWESRYTLTLESDELPVDSLSISTGSTGKTHNHDCRSRRDTH